MALKQEDIITNKVSKKDMNDVFHILSSSILIDSINTNKSELKARNVFISFFSNALEEVMRVNVVKSKSDRLKVIKLLDKLQAQRETIELANSNPIHLQIAAERLGKKVQSAFTSR